MMIIQQMLRNKENQTKNKKKTKALKKEKEKENIKKFGSRKQNQEEG